MLVDSSTTLVESRVEDLWTLNLIFLEDRGLRIQALVLHCSCVKAASEFKL